MKRAHIILLICCVIPTAVSEEIPVSIQKGEWDYTLGCEFRYHVASAQDATIKVPLPDFFWKEVGRGLVRSAVNRDAGQRMLDEKAWIALVRRRMASIEDVIIAEYEKSPDRELYAELKPIPTREQEEYIDKVVERWLIPIPVEFEKAGPARAYVSTWNTCTWEGSARIAAKQRGIPKKGSGGRIEKVYWFDRPMTGRDMLIEIAGANHRLRLVREFGHTIAILDGYGEARRVVAWPCGQFLVYLDFATNLYESIVKAYLGKYPSSWVAQVEYDPRRLILEVLNEMIPEMNKNIDGPLEYLRYSFRTYPFDSACWRAWRILPEDGLEASHKKRVLELHELWAKSPLDKIKLSDYRDAMLVHRREVIDAIVSERDRIGKEGVERFEK
jgi:hypothetical protein